MTRHQRIAALRQALTQRILVLDGAMGTTLQQFDLGAADFGGPALEGCNEALLLSRPEIIEGVHAGYLEAGADILKTNTFGSTPLVLGEYGLADRAREISALGVSLARRVADRFATPERPRWVAGSMGPTTRALSVTGGISFEELSEHFYVQAQGIHEGGADFFLIETCQDTRNVKAALLAVEKLFAEGHERIPVAVSGTIEPTGTMLAGQAVEALAASLEHADLLYVGINCATGPAFMTDHVRTLARAARTHVACVPNAGLPDENGHYLETPEMFGAALRRFADEGWLNFAGGCCGTHRGHIAALVKALQGSAPRKVPAGRRSTLSGVDFLEVTDENRPVLVGERCNVLGSKKLRELIAGERFDEAAEIARAQVKRGAQVLDVSTQQTDRDEVADLRRYLEKIVQKVRVPIMVDSTNEQAVAAALTLCQGKAIINSVNLEDGEKRLSRFVALARRFGAALVVGTIDEQGQAIDRRRKVEIARRAHDLLVGKYGMASEDLYFDALVFPCASGDAAYVGSAAETIEALRLLKQELPRSKTVLGVSNVSFGLPPAGRDVVNSVFLYHCVQAGLDLAIVNAEKLERYPSIAERDRALAEDVLFARGEAPTAEERLKAAVTAFTAHFREARPKATPIEQLPLEERLARYVVEGSKDGLAADLEAMLARARPLAIINGPLMRGMDEVGRLFNANQLIVAEVLQSAEVMKAAVAHLEPHLEKAASASRGKVLLATVKGDVHDIGKNLVEIILGNNGFEVVNLGIKVPPEKLIAAVEEHAPDLIGLSGLLVKSAHQMVATATDLARAGIELPILVGGAALSRAFVDHQIAPAYRGTVAYAKDAMAGLDLAKRLTDPRERAALEAELARGRERRAEEKAAPAASPAPARRGRLEPAAQIPPAPDLERHAISSTPLDAIWKYVNPMMLYGRHLGLKGAFVREIESLSASELARSEAGRKALEVREQVEAVKAECRQGLLAPRAVYQFFRARRDGDAVLVYGTEGEAPKATFRFPRQRAGDGLCLSDYVAPELGAGDNLCLFVVTAGAGVRARAEELKARGAFLQSHILQALALETAEAYAELLHGMIRGMWGFADPLQMTMLDRFRAGYRGRRFSFGYPACPQLEDQQILFGLLQPEQIGVRLTDGMMMDPEASVSAMVFHHPQATYFSASGEEG